MCCAIVNDGAPSQVQLRRRKTRVLFYGLRYHWLGRHMCIWYASSSGLAMRHLNSNHLETP